MMQKGGTANDCTASLLSILYMSFARTASVFYKNTISYQPFLFCHASNLQTADIRDGTGSYRHQPI